MPEIFQQFGGMLDAAHNYRTVGQDRMSAAEDQLSLANGLASGAWMDPTYDDYFANVNIQVNQTHAHANDAVTRGNVIDQCQMDGQATLATCRGIAAGLVV